MAAINSQNKYLETKKLLPTKTPIQKINAINENINFLKYKLPTKLNESIKKLISKSARARLNIRTLVGVCNSLFINTVPIINKLPNF